MSNYRAAVCAACADISDRFNGIQFSDQGEIDLWLDDPGAVIDFNRIADRPVDELTNVPPLTEPHINFPDEPTRSHFPCFSPYPEYIDGHRGQLLAGKVVSFVEGTGTKSTDNSRLRDRESTLEENGIPVSQQILILLPARIPEQLTQTLTVYYLITDGWMVAPDTWYSPDLTFSSWRRTGYGIPDIVAWKSELVTELRQRGWIPHGGTVHQLGHLTLRNRPYEYTPAKMERRTLVGEVKKSDTSLGNAVKQLYTRSDNPGYVKSRCFDEGYGIVGLRRDECRHGAGTITFDEDGMQTIPDALETTYGGDSIEGRSRADDEQKDRLLTQLDQFAAQTLLCNIRLGDLRQALQMDDQRRPYQAFRELNHLSIEEMLAACEEYVPTRRRV